jgi:hypothetical protein
MSAVSARRYLTEVSEIDVARAVDQLCTLFGDRSDVQILTERRWRPTSPLPRVVIEVPHVEQTNGDWWSNLKLMEEEGIPELFVVDVRSKDVTWLTHQQGRMLYVHFPARWPDPVLGGYLEFTAEGHLCLFTPPHIYQAVTYRGDERPL